MANRFVWNTGKNVGSGGVADLSGAGGASYTIVEHVAGATLATTDLGKLHKLVAAGAEAFNLPEWAIALVGERVGFRKGVGALDLNAYNAGDGTNNIEGETDIENTTADDQAEIWLYYSATAGRIEVDGTPRGLWL